MTATVTPIHARRAGRAISEGTASAQRINDPLLLHRVDASQLTTAPVHVVHGEVEQRQCRPGKCEGLHTCSDHHCEGHPCNDPAPQDRDPQLLRIVATVYLVIFGLCAAAGWQWLTR